MQTKPTLRSCRTRSLFREVHLLQSCRLLLLSRKLSVKSNESCETTAQSLSGVLSDHYDQESRGRGDRDSMSSIIDATNNCSLAKSMSTSTGSSDKSFHSIRSTKSVRSVHAVGSYPLGSLRVHSPSPTRTTGNVPPPDFLKSGDVVIVRDVPSGSLFGYDTRAFPIKDEDNFQGLKDIPTGAHFIWGGSNTSSLRNGFWIMSAKRASDEFGEIHVKRWDRENELLAEVRQPLQIRIHLDLLHSLDQ